MKKIDWVSKLTSRKFWVAVTGLVSGLVIAFKGSAELAETIAGCIMAGAAVIAYIVGEGLTDAASAKASAEQTKAETAEAKPEATAEEKAPGAENAAKI